MAPSDAGREQDVTTIVQQATDLRVALFYARQRAAKRTETCTHCEGSGRTWQLPHVGLTIRCVPCEGRGLVEPKVRT